MDTHHPPTVYVETQGCKLNQADTQALAAQFLAAGYTLATEPGAADVCVVNTCTVTHVADAKARQALRGMRRQSPNALVVATGCYAQRAPAQLVQLEGVDLVLGNAQKGELVAQVGRVLVMGEGPSAAGGLLLAQESTSLRTRVMGQHVHAGHDSDGLSGAQQRTRAMVKIQEGCGQVCAYCIVPKVRGRERSIHPDELVGQVQGLAGEGYKEVVLTGTQLGTYGFDVPGASLTRLLARILDETAISQLRVSSLQAHEVTNELLDLWQDSRLCPHFHLPLQSGSAQVLARMRRRYTPAQYAAAVGMVRAGVPGASVTADVIVGFPGETEELFEETYRFCEGMGFAAMHVFPYSLRPGTSAAHFKGQVEEAGKQERMARLLALGKAQAAWFRQGLVGLVRPVLWEASRPVGDAQVWSGLTDNYVRVCAASGKLVRNTVTPVRLERRQGEVLWGRIQEEG